MEPVRGSRAVAAPDLIVDDDADSVASDEALARIAEITEPRPVEIRILGRKPAIDGLEGSPSPKLEAIIVYLAFHREVVSELGEWCQRHHASCASATGGASEQFAGDW